MPDYVPKSQRKKGKKPKLPMTNVLLYKICEKIPLTEEESDFLQDFLHVFKEKYEKAFHARCK